MSKPLWALASEIPEGWRLLASLVPRDQGVSPQGIAVLGDGSWVSSQADGSDNVTLTRYDRAGHRLEELRIPGAGHGDRMRTDGQHVELFVRGVWCSIPWQTGTLPAATAVDRYRSTYRMLPFGARSWFQGEILDLDGVAIRLYGVPFRGYGPSVVDGEQRPNVPAQLEFYRGGEPTPVHVEHVGQLGRVDLTTSAAPFDDRLEPEGLTFGEVDGDPTLIVGIATGRAGHGGFTHRIYGRRWDGAP